MESSLESLLPSGAGRVALVGVAKNSGKTTTLNFLLELSRAHGRRVGMVSIGIDGEDADLLIGTGKPRVHVERGELVVTARTALARSTAAVELVDTLGFESPLGEVLVGRVREEGNIYLAGLRHRGDAKAAVEALERYGAELVFIDGAYGRTMAVDAELSDGFVLSTGAVLSPDVDEVVSKTTDLVDRLTLERAEDAWQQALFDDAEHAQRCMLGGPRRARRVLSSASALVALREIEQEWSGEYAAVAVPGLVSDSVLEALIAVDPPGVLLVRDGTVIKTHDPLWRRFRRRWQVYARRMTPLLGMSINPVAVQGYGIEGAALTEALARRWPRLPIFDPVETDRRTIVAKPGST